MKIPIWILNTVLGAALAAAIAGEGWTLKKIYSFGEDLASLRTEVHDLARNQIVYEKQIQSAPVPPVAVARSPRDTSGSGL